MWPKILDISSVNIVAISPIFRSTEVYWVYGLTETHMAIRWKAPKCTSLGLAHSFSPSIIIPALQGLRNSTQNRRHRHRSLLLWVVRDWFIRVVNYILKGRSWRTHMKVYPVGRKRREDNVLSCWQSPPKLMHGSSKSSSLPIGPLSVASLDPPPIIHLLSVVAEAGGWDGSSAFVFLLCKRYLLETLGKINKGKNEIKGIIIKISNCIGVTSFVSVYKCNLLVRLAH